MDARDSMKAIIISIVTISALAGLPSVASAQQWDPWDGTRRPPTAQVSPQDDDRYADPQDDRRDYYDDRDGQRADNRYEDRYDPRRYDPMIESARAIAAERPPIRDISTIRDMATRGTATATVIAPGTPHHPRTKKPD